VARYDGTIPPGGEGTVTVKVNTRGFRGDVLKRTKVYTNDPGHRMVILRVKAFVRVAIYVSNKYVTLRGKKGEKVSRTVEIRAEREQPLKIEAISFDLADEVTYRIEDVEKDRIYRIHFSHNPGTLNYYRGKLRLKTNYSTKPEIVIWIRGRFKD